MKLYRSKSKEKKIQAEETDVDFSAFSHIEETGQSFNSFENLHIDKKEMEALKAVGINLFDDSVAGKFLMYGNKIYWLIP